MEYAVEMDSVSVLYEYIPSFIKIGSAIHKLIRVMHRHTDNVEIA
jgi:hypothetical protein